MALTPEQVLNKHFQTTQFRRGYEERDVDDFLDEIVAEMRSLIEQRDDYLKQLNDCRASKNQPAVRGDGGATAAMPPVGRPGDDAKLGGLTAKIQDAERAFKAAADRAAKAKAEADAAERAARERIERAKAEADRAELAAKAAVDDKSLNDAQARLTGLTSQVAEAEARLNKAQDATRIAEQAARTAEERATRARAEADAAAADAAKAREQASANLAAPQNKAVEADAAGVIALAQRLHDEHVAAGETRRRSLIGEAESKHHELISTAQARHDELISTAQAQHDELTRKAQEMSAAATAQRDRMISEATTQRDQMLAEATTQRDQMLTEARERSTGMLAEAQQKKNAVLEELDRQKTLLDRKIEELRGFEKNYRSNLKSYIQGQLHDLDDSQEPREPAQQG